MKKRNEKNRKKLKRILNGNNLKYFIFFKFIIFSAILILNIIYKVR
jgi:hypothetical protein